jgi:Zn-finger in ubiquitin-hydrolases and other protein
MASEEPMSAAAAAQSDAWMAHKLHAIEQLTGLYGFPPEVAEQAVDFLVDVTSTPSPIDVAECCNYILDSGLAVDQGGPITPISHCPHVLRHCSITPSQLPFQPSLAPCSFDPADLVPTGNAKSEAANDDVCRATENWLCLECAVVRCSRYCQGHAHQHWQETQTGTNDPDGHCVAVSLSDLSVWCHRCQAYLSTSPGAAGRDLLVPLLEQLERSKSIEPAILILQPEAEPRSSKKLKQESDDSNRPIDSISEEEKDEEESGM